jgi:bifunctional DNA-binding transcriptional regulator/antitoxin component of YhaV-PrlF toxin-antitoxin module
MSEIVATARLRSRNQLTLPDPIVQAAGLDEGATFVVELDDADPDVVRLRRIRTSYAGALKGLYEPTGEYLEGERSGWKPK